MGATKHGFCARDRPKPVPGSNSLDLVSRQSCPRTVAVCWDVAQVARESPTEQQRLQLHSAQSVGSGRESPDAVDTTAFEATLTPSTSQFNFSMILINKPFAPRRNPATRLKGQALLGLVRAGKSRRSVTPITPKPPISANLMGQSFWSGSDQSKHGCDKPGQIFGRFANKITWFSQSVKV